MATRSKRASDIASQGASHAGDVAIRPLAPGEARTLAAVMRRSFGGLAGMMFSPGKAAFVAEQGGRVVGGVAPAVAAGVAAAGPCGDPARSDAPGVVAVEVADPGGEAMTLTTHASGIVSPCCARRHP